MEPTWPGVESRDRGGERTASAGLALWSKARDRPGPDAIRSEDDRDDLHRPALAPPVPGPRDAARGPRATFRGRARPGGDPPRREPQRRFEGPALLAHSA